MQFSSSSALQRNDTISFHLFSVLFKTCLSIFRKEKLRLCCHNCSCSILSPDHQVPSLSWSEFSSRSRVIFSIFNLPGLYLPWVLLRITKRIQATITTLFVAPMSLHQCPWPVTCNPVGLKQFEDSRIWRPKFYANHIKHVGEITKSSPRRTHCKLWFCFFGW